MAEALDPILPSDIDELTRAVLEAACARELTLATAESCTGGLLASLLTDVPGCSHAFDRGFVVYTDAPRSSSWTCRRRFLPHGGAVSQPTAIAMADGAIRRFESRRGGVDHRLGRGGRRSGAARRSGPLRLRPSRRLHPPSPGAFGDIGRGPLRIECLRVALKMLQQAVAL
jgi:nicotinamide-nucleotide amidase